MQSPKPINLTSTGEVEAAGWIAEARDSDGHLISTLAWVDCHTINENINFLAEFIRDYDGTGGTVAQVFPSNLKDKL